MRHLLAVLLIGAVAVGCSSKKDDPFTADIKMMCNAGQGRSDLPPEMRALAAAKEISEKIKTPEAMRLMVAVSEAAPSEKRGLMADALKRAGIERCALLGD